MKRRKVVEEEETPLRLIFQEEAHRMIGL